MIKRRKQRTRTPPLLAFALHSRARGEIENKLHWTLDVVFQEDADRKRNKHAAQNFSLINKIALNILKNDLTKNISIRRKKNIASWNFKYLLMLLKF